MNRELNAVLFFICLCDDLLHIIQVLVYCVQNVGLKKRQV